jgi:hypothetical protein
MGFYVYKNFKKGDWITNHVGSLKSFWPRRNVLYKEGPPKKSSVFSEEELTRQGILGIYLDEDVEDYFALATVFPKDYTRNIEFSS